jgi:release factor glutamine methyltransferase
MNGYTLGAALVEAMQRIEATDARALLCHVTDHSPSYLIAHPEVELDDSAAGRFSALVERRAAGEPVAYLTGEREFYGRSFHVTPAVLIPRPETELLVDLALERIERNAPVRILDVGTGSGCVAIAIATERPQCKIVGLDDSVAALAVARRNAVSLHVGNVAFLKSDWFSALGDEEFALIVSNPPYVATGDPHLDQGDLRFEPREALTAGADGLDAIRRLVAGAHRHLAAGGWLLFEHGYDHAEQARALLQETGYEDVFSAGDLAGIARVSGGRLTLGQNAV